MSSAVDTARREWEEGYRRLEQAARDPARGEPLHAQVEAVLDELRRRVGATYTLDELAGTYRRAESWTHEVLAEQAAPDWPRTLAMVEDAAFHVYSRGAADYTP